MSERLEKLKQKVSLLPNSPGVYKYFDKEGTIIYVGKAKNLKQRVSSYFRTNVDRLKTAVLVKHIYDLEYIVVENEADALFLENNIIKENQPKYNILLKDGKTYPWICITKERFPRVFKTRQVTKKGGEFYGPYSAIWVLDNMLDLIRKLYPIRTCKYLLTEENIGKEKFKVCLDYHIKKCKGPCQKFQSEEEYNQMIDEIREIIKGNSHKIKQYLLEEIRKHAEKLEFEKAQELKIKLDAITHYQEKTIITTTKDNNIDVYSIEEEENIAYINTLHINGGSITKAFTIEYVKKLDESKEEILAASIIQLREMLHSNSRKIIIPFDIELELDGIEKIVPQKGDNRKLLDLSLRNVQQYKIDKYKHDEKFNSEQKSTQILTSLRDKLRLDKMPIHIECFDNSNTSGTNAVAGCVVYKNAKPSKKDYRRFNIKSVEGPDDYASMREVVYRRYKRLSEEKTPLPDLIIADGGIGQMGSIKEALDELGLKIPIAGLAKNDKHQTAELLFGFPPQVIGMNPTEQLFRFLTSMQDEVHRYAITFHKEKRSKSQIHSELDEIKGLGEKSQKKLILAFKSVKRIREASLDDIVKIVGTRRASIVYNYFHNE